MSGKLREMAMDSSLKPSLYRVFLVLCDVCGQDDGVGCYPSIEYVAFKSRFSVRQTQRIMRDLEDKRYIEPVAYIGGGRRHATEYRIHIERVPMMPTYGEYKQRMAERAAEIEAAKAAKKAAKKGRADDDRD